MRVQKHRERQFYLAGHTAESVRELDLDTGSCPQPRALSLL